MAGLQPSLSSLASGAHPGSSSSVLFAAVTWEVGLSFAKMTSLLLTAGDAWWVGCQPCPWQVLSLSPLPGGVGPHGVEAP